jgi:oligopeptide transport system ATP-binding protein
MNQGNSSGNQEDSVKLLEVTHLKTSFFTHLGEVKAVDDVSICLGGGETLGIVGESGSGKSVTMLSIMRLLSDNGRIVSGTIQFRGMDLTKLPEGEMEHLRGKQIGMIFQDPMTSLNPVFTIGNQLTEMIARHLKLGKKDAWDRAVEMLSTVMIPSPDQRMRQFPHELSGGMRQRVMTAMALCCHPDILIADEPTTALDVTIQAQIIDLLKELKTRTGTSVILITHDLGVVAGLCDKVCVMYAGQVVERGSSLDIFYTPGHPYTKGLLKSVPNPKKMMKERLVPIRGAPPDLLKPPVGCAFAPRCDQTMKICILCRPPLFEVGDGHGARCFLNHPDLPATP